ncbi:hypothetical protein J6590_027978 [Homalodisca vitripennis]|nr:hypothetical protein J6590_027978 [Homalodisca vitripennis]
MSRVRTVLGTVKAESPTPSGPPHPNTDRHPVRMTSRLGTDITSLVPVNEVSRIPRTTLSAILTLFWVSKKQYPARITSG